MTATINTAADQITVNGFTEAQLAQMLAELKQQKASAAMISAREEIIEICGEAALFFAALLETMSQERTAPLATASMTQYRELYKGGEGHFVQRLQKLSGKAGISVKFYMDNVATAAEKAEYEARKVEK